MKLTFLCVGKLKERYWREACEEYSKRLRRFGKTEIIELPDWKTPDVINSTQAKQVLEKEGDRILKSLKPDGIIIALAVEGQSMTSEDFAQWIGEQGVKGISHITFIIGGSLGLSETVLQKADTLLSFSKMTFPHQMIRVILLEQVYRAFKILNQEPYHK